jgi:SAM-dependent methyltransferase
MDCRAVPGTALYEQALRRLDRTNASAVIPIESTGSQLMPRVDFDRRWRLADRDDRFLDEAHERQYQKFLDEEHHRQYGSRRAPSPWALGKCVFESLVAAGLRPEHRVLDFACGALRFGQWLIPYLDQGNYCGVDSHLPSLEAAATYELPLHGLEGKRPRLLWNEDLDLFHFGTEFDWIVDYNGSRRLRPRSLRPLLCRRFAEVLVSGGRLLTSPRPAYPDETLAQCGLVLSRKWAFDQCPFVLGRSRLIWWEFVRE